MTWCLDPSFFNAHPVNLLSPPFPRGGLLIGPTWPLKESTARQNQLDCFSCWPFKKKNFCGLPDPKHSQDALWISVKTFWSYGDGRGYQVSSFSASAKVESARERDKLEGVWRESETFFDPVMESRTRDREKVFDWCHSQRARDQGSSSKVTAFPCPLSSLLLLLLGCPNSQMLNFPLEKRSGRFSSRSINWSKKWVVPFYSPAILNPFGIKAPLASAHLAIRRSCWTKSALRYRSQLREHPCGLDSTLQTHGEEKLSQSAHTCAAALEVPASTPEIRCHQQETLWT